MGEFKIDTDAISKAISEYDQQLKDLNEIKKNIQDILKALKNDGWNSKAGEACMKKFDDKWANEIDKYTKLLDFLEGVLNGTKPEFENLINESNKLQSIG